jgi:MoaA/NifB/PqqE/SkfB family radical SAM enzyme
MAVELQSSCKRDCVFCPRHHNDTGIRKNADGKQIIQKMPTDKAKDIMLQAEALGYRGKISFHRLSESFLDPRYIEMAEFAVEHGLRVFDNTNGDILKRKPALIKELDGLVEFIKIGLYDYATWKEKKAEMDFWNAQFEKTRIEFSCPLEIPEIRQGARLQTERSKRVAKRRREKILDLNCTGPLRALLVRYDGEVSLCCQDDEATFNLGNAFETPIDEIWWSDKHVGIAKALLEPKSRHQFPLCSQCFRKQGKPTMWEAFKQTVWHTGFRMGFTSPVLEAQKPERLVVNLDGLLDGMPEKENRKKSKSA